MKGKRIAVLEARLGKQLADLVTQRGGVPFHAPALAELPDLDPAKIATLVHSMAERPPKLVVFQTGVGTRALFSATDPRVHGVACAGPHARDVGSGNTAPAVDDVIATAGALLRNAPS